MDGAHGKNAKIFVPDRKLRNSFLIHHSAQDVKYKMTEFVERNVDCIPDQFLEVME
jgi:myosin heavy subunit